MRFSIGILTASLCVRSGRPGTGTNARRGRSRRLPRRAQHAAEYSRTAAAPPAATAGETTDP